MFIVEHVLPHVLVTSDFNTLDEAEAHIESVVSPDNEHVRYDEVNLLDEDEQVIASYVRDADTYEKRF